LLLPSPGGGIRPRQHRGLLALDWPPFFFARWYSAISFVFLAIRVAVIVGQFPAGPRARAFPHRSDGYAGRSVLGGGGSPHSSAGLPSVGSKSGCLTTLGLSLEGHQLVAYALGLCLMAIALEAVWRRPVAPHESAEEVLPESHHLGRGARNALLVDRHRAVVGASGYCEPCRASGSFW